MVKPNYSFAKRQRDIAKKQKQEEKRQRKAEAKRQRQGTEPGDPAAPVADGEQSKS